MVSLTSSVKRVPTHSQFILKNKDKRGIETDIVKIMYNDEWKTITLFGEEFKVNLKYDTAEDFSETWQSICSEFKTDKPVVATLKDKSDEDLRNIDVDVTIVQTARSKGGRDWKVNRGVFEIESSEA